MTSKFGEPSSLFARSGVSAFASLTHPVRCVNLSYVSTPNTNARFIDVYLPLPSCVRIDVRGTIISLAGDGPVNSYSSGAWSMTVGHARDVPEQDLRRW